MDYKKIRRVERNNNAILFRGRKTTIPVDKIGKCVGRADNNNNNNSMEIRYRTARRIRARVYRDYIYVCVCGGRVWPVIVC